MTYSIRQFTLIFVLLTAITVATTGHATIINLLPADQVVELGNQARVDIVVDELDGALVGAFDMVLAYDPSLLAINNIMFGADLGGVGDVFESVNEQPGSVNVASVSLVFDLSALQSGFAPITLFSLTFDTLALGVSALTLTENILGGGFLGDDLGNLLPVDGIGGGRIEIVGPVDVPEPAALMLMLVGLLALARVQLRH